MPSNPKPKYSFIQNIQQTIHISNKNLFMELKRKIFYFEAGLLFFFILWTVFSNFIANWIYWLSFPAIYVAMGFFEGYKLHSLVFIPIFFLELIDSLVVRIICDLLVLGVLYYFISYEIPEASGKFGVGYREFTSEKLLMSVFYPTLSTGHDALWCPKDQPQWKIYQAFLKLQKKDLPTIAAQYVCSFSQFLKMGVRTNAPIIDRKELPKGDHGRKFPVIIYSHGMGGHRNNNCLFLKEWASKGFIVMSVQHENIVFMDGVTDHYAFRHDQLIKRSKDIDEVLGFVLDRKQIKDLFGDENVEVDIDSVSIAGHSFGGATALYSAVHDQRVTGSVLALDPWMFPIDEPSYKPVGKPLFIVCAPLFEKTFPGNMEKVKKFAQANNTDQNSTMMCYFQGAGHTNFIDIGLFLPREEHWNGGTCEVEMVGPILHNHRVIVDAFWDVMVLDAFGMKVLMNIDEVEKKFKEARYTDTHVPLTIEYKF